MLSTAKKGIVHKPHLLLLYGVDKWGKSTFASEAPRPLFVGLEEGTNNLDVARVAPQTLADVRTTFRELATEEHDYQTVVVDTVDWLTPMVEAEAIARWNSQEGKHSIGIDEPGFGRGRVLAFEIWRNLLPIFSAARDERGLNVILLAHAIIQKFEDPSQAQSYDRYSLKLQTGLKTDVAGLLREYVDSVLFGNFDISVDKGDRHRAFGSGDRVLYTDRRPGFEAGNRFNLPFELKMVRGRMWSEYAKYVDVAPDRADDSAVIREKIEALFLRVKQEDLRPKIRKKIDAAKTIEQLRAVCNQLDALIGSQG